MGQTFFGLTSTDKEIFLEPIFLLMYYCGFSYSEVYNLPVSIRRWYIERVNKELTKGNKDPDNPDAPPEPGPSRAPQDNSPEVRALQGRARTHVPSRLIRFT